MSLLTWHSHWTSQRKLFSVFQDWDFGTMKHSQFLSFSSALSLSLSPSLPLATAGSSVAHDLKVHTFKSPTWCALCGEFIWGVVNQGLSLSLSLSFSLFMERYYVGGVRLHILTCSLPLSPLSLRVHV